METLGNPSGRERAPTFVWVSRACQPPRCQARDPMPGVMGDQTRMGLRRISLIQETTNRMNPAGVVTR